MVVALVGGRGTCDTRRPTFLENCSRASAGTLFACPEEVSMYNRISRVVIVSVCVMFVSAYAVAQGITQPKQGQGGSVVQGAAGTEGSVGDNGLEHCPKPMGALAVVEPQQEILYGLRRYNLQSPVGLIRMMIQ